MKGGLTMLSNIGWAWLLVAVVLAVAWALAAFTEPLKCRWCGGKGYRIDGRRRAIGCVCQNPDEDEFQ